METFWRAYNNIITIEHLPPNTDFFLFKDYIKPEWEDIKNKNGGRWIYDIAWDKSKHQFISQHTENIWTKLIMSLIGLIGLMKTNGVNWSYGVGDYGASGGEYRKWRTPRGAGPQ